MVTFEDLRGHSLLVLEQGHVADFIQLLFKDKYDINVETSLGIDCLDNSRADFILIHLFQVAHEDTANLLVESIQKAVRQNKRIIISKAYATINEITERMYQRVDGLNLPTIIKTPYPDEYNSSIIEAMLKVAEKRPFN